jgi:DNA-binding transcriptional LysR family regulator
MELRHLRYFMAVAAEGNFTRAAENLGIGQPPLSQQIKSLERELGVELFRRTPHGAELTSAGEAFLVEARRVISDAQRAVHAAQRAARGETGHIRIGFTGSAAFNPVVTGLVHRFKRRYPAVELTLEEANTPILLEWLLDERLDAVFLRPGLLQPEGVKLHRFADEPMKVVLPTHHPLAAKKRLPLNLLANEPFVLVPGPTGATLYDEIVRACAEAGFVPQLAQPAPQLASVVSLVAAGLGVSIVPASLTQVKLRGVRYVSIQGSAIRARFALAWRERNRSAALRNLVALL